MDIVSQKSFIKLDKQITCEYICQEAQKIVTKFQQAQPDLSEVFLVMEIKTISQTIDETICKLEYKN
jgi:hypothetical protein